MDNNISNYARAPTLPLVGSQIANGLFCTYHQPCHSRLTLGLARTGKVGGATPPPPLRFFADSEKTSARSAAGF